jgi:hypothetical protein
MLILNILNKFVSAFRSALDGTTQEIGTQDLYPLNTTFPFYLLEMNSINQGCFLTHLNRNVGARVRYVFNDMFLQNLNKLNSSTILSLHEIRTAIRNAVVRILNMIIDIFLSRFCMSL